MLKAESDNKPGCVGGLSGLDCLTNGPRFLKRTLVIHQNTIQKDEAHRSCLTVEAANQFKNSRMPFPILTSWRARVSSCRGSLTLRSLTLLSIQVRSTDFSDAVPKVGIAFYKRYPESGGYLTMSPVGFNSKRQRKYTVDECPCLLFRSTVSLKSIRLGTVSFLAVSKWYGHYLEDSEKAV
jgi:hypothetical protein